MENSKFMHLIAGLQGSAWMLLGKIANPMTGKVVKDIDAAKETIDVLLMLQEKTKGNLSDEESNLLSNALQQLQFNYLEEVKAAKSEKKEEK